MPSIGGDHSAVNAEDCQSGDVGDRSSVECDNVIIKSPVASEAAPATGDTAVGQLHDAAAAAADAAVAGNSECVNLANVDHVQTVLAVHQPATSSTYEYPGVCPICGDKISGMCRLAAC